MIEPEEKIKVVLDTNVFISGIFFSGPPFQILKAWHDGRVQILISPEILEEYLRVGEVLGESHPEVDIGPILELLVLNAEIAQPQELPTPVCTDPDDDKFLACALSGKCKIIISGDKHLLAVNGFRGLNILRPRKFIDDYLN